MPERPLHHAMLGIGLGIVILSIGLGYLLWPARSRQRELVVGIWQTGHKHIIEPHGEESSLLYVKITAPDIIYVQDSSVVTASADFGIISRALLLRPFTFSLSLGGAGLDIEPKDWLNLSPSQANPEVTVKWSIRANEPGHYRLVFNPKLGLPIESGGRNKPQTFVAPKIEFVPQAEIPIIVKSKWSDYVAKAWPFLAAFMGSLITLPGIIAWKDRKRGRNKDTEPTPELPI
jgi:hypothetical protein